MKRSITTDDLYHIAYIEGPRISPDGAWVAYVQITPDRMEDTYTRNIWLAPTAGGEPVQLTRGGKDTAPRWSPDGDTLAFVSGRGEKPQIYVLRVAAPGGEARALTEMPHGASAPAWSPDGAYIAFLAPAGVGEKEKAEPEPADQFEAEQRKTRKAYEEKKRWDPRPVRRLPYREGTEYRTNRYDQVYVVAVAEGEHKPRRLTNIDADHDPPEWMPDGAYLLTARTAHPERDEPRLWRCLYRIRVEDSKAEQLTETDYADYAPLPSPDGKWIVYRRQHESKSANVPRLAVIPAAGGEPQDLTLELDRTPVDYAWARDGSAMYFAVQDQGTVEIYAAAPDGGPAKKRTAGLFDIHSLDAGPDGGIAFAASTPQWPPELFWQPAGREKAERLTAANDALLDEVEVQPTQRLRFTAPDGQEIQGWYILPPDFEEGKAYPLALNIHGGPHAMWGPATRSMWHEWQLHAARGYVVFYCNPRGSDGYGSAFRAAAVGAWGEADMPDVMAGVDALLEQGFVDEARMAVTGGSYGGFMTAWVVGHTDRFAAAVAQRGVYNMFSMIGTTDIPQFNTDELGELEPWEDPDTYWKYSPVSYAPQITTPLLLIHSENDFRVPISEAEQLFAYVRRAGGTVEMFRYPEEGHELSRSGAPLRRASRLNEMVAWFDRYCKTSDPQIMGDGDPHDQ